MPDYPYRVLHDPPHRSDRVTVRPWEHDIAGFNVLLGTLLLVEATPWVRLLGVYALPTVIYAAAGALLAGGGLAALAGLQWPRRSISVGWAVERFGWLSTAAGWVAIGAVLLNVDPLMVPGIILAAFLAAGAALRWRLLGHVEDEARGKRRRKVGGG